MEADEVQHKMASVLGQVGDRHCEESTLDASEQDGPEDEPTSRVRLSDFLELSLTSFSLDSLVDKCCKVCEFMETKGMLQIQDAVLHGTSPACVRQWRRHLQHSETNQEIPSDMHPLSSCPE